MDPVTLYGALSRLEQRGLIEQLASDDPRRRLYRLTGRDGRTSYQALADSTVVAERPALDLACGDGQLLELACSEETTWLGFDRNSS